MKNKSKGIRRQLKKSVITKKKANSIVYIGT